MPNIQAPVDVGATTDGSLRVEGVERGREGGGGDRGGLQKAQGGGGGWQKQRFSGRSEAKRGDYRFVLIV